MKKSKIIPRSLSEKLSTFLAQALFSSFSKFHLIPLETYAPASYIDGLSKNFTRRKSPFNFEKFCLAKISHYTVSSKWLNTKYKIAVYKRPCSQRAITQSFTTQTNSQNNTGKVNKHGHSSHSNISHTLCQE